MVLNKKEDIKEALNLGGILVGLTSYNDFENVKVKDINMLYKKYKNDEYFCYVRLGDKLGFGNGDMVARFLCEEMDEEVKEFIEICGYYDIWWRCGEW